MDTKSKYDGDTLLLRVEEVAQLLGLSRSKVYEMTASGELPVVRMGTAVRVPKKALEGWIEQNTQPVG